MSQLAHKIDGVQRPLLEIGESSKSRTRLHDAKPFRKKPWTDRKTLEHITRSIDAGLLFLFTLSAMSALAGGVLDVSLGVALPYILTVPLILFGVMNAGGYSFNFSEKVMDHMTKVVMGAGIAALALVGLVLLTPLGGDNIRFASFAVLSFVIMMTAHAHHITICKQLMRSGRLSENVVIVGATKNAAKLIERNERDKDLNIVAIFDDRLGRAPSDVHGVPVIGTLDHLMDWEKLPDVDRIIVTVTSKAQDRVQLLINRLRYLPNRVVLLLDLDDLNPNGASLAEVADAPAAYVSGAPKDARRALVKRTSDLIIGSAMLICFAPFMALIAVMIKLDSRGPVFFKQKRHGFNNQVIRVWKFRTMRPDKKAEDGIITQVTSDDDRITKLGRFLRKTSLDELPQLFNIIKGDMSLVGPRPHAVGMTTQETEVHDIVSDYAHRHRVKPGLTGWAQINGSRGPVHTYEEVEERVRLDMEYVNRASLWFDLYVMAMTAPCLLGDDNVR